MTYRRRLNNARLIAGVWTTHDLLQLLFEQRMTYCMCLNNAWIVTGVWTIHDLFEVFEQRMTYCRCLYNTWLIAGVWITHDFLQVMTLAGVASLSNIPLIFGYASVNTGIKVFRLACFLGKPASLNTSTHYLERYISLAWPKLFHIIVWTTHDFEQPMSYCRLLDNAWWLVACVWRTHDLSQVFEQRMTYRRCLNNAWLIAGFWTTHDLLHVLFEQRVTY